MVRLINPFKVHSWAEEECGEETSTLLVGISGQQQLVFDIFFGLIAIVAYTGFNIGFRVTITASQHFILG